MLPLSASGVLRNCVRRRSKASPVVVPVHDETAIADGAGPGARSVAGGLALRLIVVDDGSTDGSAGVLEQLARSIPCLRVVRHAGNRGYGAALRSGFAAARYAWVLVIDGDGQFDPAQLSGVVAALDGHDGVIGYRARRADPLLRRVNTAAWNGLVRRLFGLTTRDLNCAFKLLPTALVQDEALMADGAVISAEILVRARSGYRFAECRSRTARGKARPDAARVVYTGIGCCACISAPGAGA
jgi:glycosyltransferase involved in cell wall biosynthesis